jgi:hypothetical protein
MNLPLVSCRPLRVFFWPTVVASMCFETSLGEPSVVKVPGKIKENPITFSAALNLNPSEAVVIPKTTVVEDKEVTKVGVELLDRRWVGRDKMVWKELENPAAISGLYAPVPLEIEVREGKRDSAITGRIVPDSVAAWNRLKKWQDLQKRVSKDKIAQIDQSAADVERKTTALIMSGAASKEAVGELQASYDKFSYALGVAFDGSNDIDVTRQLSTAILGVRNERIAWDLSSSRGVPAINPQYGKMMTQASGDPPIQKSVDDLEPASSVDIQYSGHPQQIPRSALHYKSVYELGRSTVAICDRKGVAFATGTVIGRNLVLTCAHAVARTGRGGSPAFRGPKLLVKVGYYVPDDPGTPPAGSLPAKVIFEGLNYLEAGSDPLDFALLKVDGLEDYCKKKLEAADGIRKQIEDAEGTPKQDPVGLRRPDAFFTPLAWVPLANFEPKAQESFFITGHPGGMAKLVSDWGYVIFPRSLEVAEKEELRRTLNREAPDQATLTQLQERFDRTYKEENKPTDDTLFFKYNYANRSPGIGVICATSPGNSGSGAIVMSGSEASIVGLLVDGQPSNPKPWTPGLERHEQLLPAMDIISQLDKYFKAEKGSPPFTKSWRSVYGVKILKKNDDGEIEEEKIPVQ